MNVVIFGQGLGKPRQLNLSGITASIVAVAAVGVLAAASFAGGYWYSSNTGSGVSQDELKLLGRQVQSQQKNIALIRNVNDDTRIAIYAGRD